MLLAIAAIVAVVIGGQVLNDIFGGIADNTADIDELNKENAELQRQLDEANAGAGNPLNAQQGNPDFRVSPAPGRGLPPPPISLPPPQISSYLNLEGGGEFAYAEGNNDGAEDISTAINGDNNEVIVIKDGVINATGENADYWRDLIENHVNRGAEDLGLEDGDIDTAIQGEGNQVLVMEHGQLFVDGEWDRDFEHLVLQGGLDATEIAARDQGDPNPEVVTG